MTKFATIVADPPWPVAAGRPLSGYVVADGVQQFNGPAATSRPLAYPTMTPAQIAALRVPEFAADDAHLYLWTINRYIEDAFQIARAWGFAYSTMLVWAKNPMGGGLGGCYGIATEYVLFCRKGSLAAKKDINTTWFNWKRPYDERGKPKHSAKPPAFMEMVEQVSPGPYLEMFARSNRPGWVAWGNQCKSAQLDMHGVFA